MTFENKILTIRNFLSVEDHTLVVEKTLKSSNWYFGRASDINATYQSKFWGIELGEDEFFSKNLVEKINGKFKKNFDLNTVRANGQCRSQCGYFHRDYERSNVYTLVYFVNPIWDVNWGGNLVFFDESTQNIHNEPFEPNKAVLFPSNTLHYGSEPTNLCLDVRVTVAFVLEDLDAT
jgi:hypothetical protein